MIDQIPALHLTQNFILKHSIHSIKKKNDIVKNPLGNILENKVFTIFC